MLRKWGREVKSKKGREGQREELSIQIRRVGKPLTDDF